MFIGSGTALITPFINGLVDYEALERLIEMQIREGSDALIILGTTGEASTIYAAEKEKIIEFSIKKINKRVPAIIGTGANSTACSVENSINAEKLGADALLIVTPYYNKCTQSGLIAHYNTIADAVGIPIITYNVPSRTGVNIVPDTLAKMAEHKNIAAIKEASGNIDQIAEVARLTRGKLALYSGNDGDVVPVLSLGGQGVISVVANIAPKYMHDLTTSFLSGDIKKARDMQLDILPLVKAIFSEVNPIPIKKAVSLMGLCNNELRMPLTPMEEANAVKLRECMLSFNLI